MRAKSWLASLALLLGGCASLPTLTERPEEYWLYRTARVGPTQEERLRAAQRYLKVAPHGPHAQQLRLWFDQAEEQYFMQAFDRLPNLYAYRQALPEGPHHEDVRTRIELLEGRRTRLRTRESEEDAKIRATGARLAAADAGRRAFVATFKDWTARLTHIKTFGEPTSELADETIYQFRLSAPRGSCQGDRCRKLLELSYEVPGERELVPRAALLEVQLELERGLLTRARLAGPELWTRLAEALSLSALPSPTPEQRADAVNRSALLVRALLEPVLPMADCDVKSPQPGSVVERQCAGLSARMLAGQSPTEDDVLEIAPSAP